MLLLKKNMPEFEMVEGAFKGVKFVHNRPYRENEIPPSMRRSFVLQRPVTPVIKGQDTKKEKEK